MAMAPLKVTKAALTLVLLLLLAASTLVVSAEEAPPPSSAANHNDAADGDLSGPEALSSVPAAAASTTGTDGDATTTTYSGWAMYEGGEYLMEVGIGAPVKKFKAVADTGSDVTWTRKDHCDPAKRRECPSPSDLSQQDCVFRKQYGSLKLGTTGFMADERLFFFPSSSSKGAGGESAAAAPASVPVDLGCAEECHDDKGDMDCHRLIPAAAEGVIGLNRGPMSLLKKLKATRLSYCLQRDRMSPLWIGGAKLSLAASAGGLQTTPLVGHAGTDFGSVWANRYYVKLEGVSVTTAATTTTAAAAAPPVSIPGEAFNHRSNDVEGKKGKGVMFVDSGCTYSKLETAAFNVVKNLLANELKAEPFRNSSNWTCFKVQYNAAADANNIFVNLHLAKDGDAGATATMSLGWSNYMQPGDKEGSSSCLAIKDSGQSISVLGNFQQQKIHMLFDLDDEKLFFVPVQDCSASNIN